MNPRKLFGAVDTLGFALQLIIVGFLLRSLQVFLLSRNPESNVGKALAFSL